MKKLTFSKIIFFFSLFVLATTACKKDEESTNGTMTAKIGGSSWKAKEIGAVVLPGLINITGKASNGQTITITIQSGQKGDYFLDENQDHVAAFQESEGAQGFVSNAPNGLGFVNITEIDLDNSTISGTFEFNAERPTDGALKEIREGAFTDVKFEKQVTTSGPSTLSCKVDGQTFTPSAVFATLSSSKIIISASTADLNKTIGLTLPSDIAVGEFTLSTFSTYTAQYNLNQNQFMGADSGKVKITKHDKPNHKLEGTFYFDASDFMGTVSATVTNGTFSVNY